MLAYEMLSGDNPFYHENPEQVALKVQKKKLTYSKHLSGPCVSLLKGLLTRCIYCLLEYIYIVRWDSFIGICMLCDGIYCGLEFVCSCC